MVKNGTVIDGTGAAPVADGLVVIAGDRITAVGRAAGFALPAGVEYVDAKGGAILPGIIDAHVHITASPAARRIYFLLKGVTAVCDMGSTLQDMPTFSEDHASGPAARGFHSGPMITVPGGYPDIVWHGNLNYEVTTPEEARRAAAGLVDWGADAIKIPLEPGSLAEPWPTLDLPMVRALVAEAHARGKLVRAHIGRTNGTDVLDLVLEGGVDVVEHIPLPAFSGLDAYNLFKDSGHYDMTAADKAGLARLAAAGVVMVPTLTAYTLLCDAPELTAAQKAGCYDFYLEPVRYFHDLGGAVALGNDYGAGGIAWGMPAREMELLEAAGLTPLEVIEAGTQAAARVCGHGGELGVLAPGKLADIIVVAGDPLDDLAALDRVTAVIKGGQLVMRGP